MFVYWFKLIICAAHVIAVMATDNARIGDGSQARTLGRVSIVFSVLGLFSTCIILSVVLPLMLMN